MKAILVSDVTGNTNWTVARDAHAVTGDLRAGRAVKLTNQRPTAVEFDGMLAVVNYANVVAVVEFENLADPLAGLAALREPTDALSMLDGLRHRQALAVTG